MPRPYRIRGGVVQISQRRLSDFILFCQELPGAWMYTGGLENRRKLVREISSNRCLWGNGEEALCRSRSPQFVASLFAKENLPHPRLQNLPLTAAKGERWVLKPTHGAGGTGIVLWTGQEQPPNSRPGIYCQEFIEGQPVAAVYVGDGEMARLKGVTHQLVGESWLRAGRFRYCGSIGPVDLPAKSRVVLETMGNVLARGCRFH